MLNIVEKYTVDTAVESEDGVVAIEYVLVAGSIVTALLVVFGLFGTELLAELNEQITRVRGAN